MKIIEQYESVISEYNFCADTVMPVKCRFTYNDIPFICQITPCDGDNDYTVRLTAKLGFLPYTSENLQKREQLLEFFSPYIRKGDITINRNCDITLPLQTKFDGIPYAKKMLSAISLTLLDAQDKIKVFRKIIHENKKHEQITFTEEELKHLQY